MGANFPYQNTLNATFHEFEAVEYQGTTVHSVQRSQPGKEKDLKVLTESYPSFCSQGTEEQQRANSAPLPALPWFCLPFGKKGN